MAWPALQLWLSGDWRWVERWIVGLWFLALCGACIGWLYRKDPALLAERYRTPRSGGQSRPDTLIVYGLLLGFIVWIVLPPLDARRLGWTPRPPPWLGAGGGVLLLGAGFFLVRSFTDTRSCRRWCASRTERRPHVVSTAVYGLVRHPMYLGARLMFLGGPLVRGSARGLLVGLGLVLLLMRRIVGEEKPLARELEGCEAYRDKVRYRLAPRVW